MGGNIFIEILSKLGVIIDRLNNYFVDEFKFLSEGVKFKKK